MDKIGINPSAFGADPPGNSENIREGSTSCLN
jgi:hypothetical protein